MPDTTHDAKLAKQADDLKSELDEVYAANERTAEAYDRAVEQRDQLSDENESLAEKLELLESELVSAADARQQEFNSQIDSLREQSESDAARIEQLQSELQVKLADVDALDAQLANATKLIDQTTESLVLSRRDAETAQSQVPDLTNRIESLEQEKADLKESHQQTLQDLEGHNKQLSNELLQRDNVIATQKSTHDNLAHDHEQLTTDHNGLTTACKALERDMQTAATRERDLSAQLASLNSELAITQAKQDELVAQLREQEQAAADQISQLRSDLKTESANGSRLKADLVAIGKDRESVTQTLAKERADRVLANRSAAKLNESLFVQLTQSHAELLDIRTQLVLETSNHKLTADQKTSQANDLRQTEALLSNFVRDLEQVGGQWKEQSAQLKAAREANQNTEHRLTLKIRELETQIQSMQQQVDDTDAVVRRERSTNQELVKQLAEQARQHHDHMAQLEANTVDSGSVDSRSPDLELPAPVKKTKQEKPKQKKLKRKSKPASRSATKRKSGRSADDLTVIEGIGPKIRDLLISERIKTFKKLSTTKVDSLVRILSKAGLSAKRYDPSTWPAQAKLAADGNLGRLNELKKNVATNWVTHCVRPVH